MLLVVDIGNTNVKAIVYENRKEVFFKAIFTDKKAKVNYFREFFTGVHDLYPEIEGFVFSSVVPSISSKIYRIIKNLYKMDGLVVETSVCKDLKIRFAHPEEIGADLLAITEGALSKYKAPIIMCDLGTATKIMVINEKEEFCGGLIIPGLTVSNKAMQVVIPHLPKVELSVPNKLVNDDTMSTIQAGLMYGIIYQVKGLVGALEEEFGFKATKILTGGYGKYIKDNMEDYIFDEYLGSEGLVEIFYKYKK